MKVFVVLHEMIDDREYHGISGVYSSQDLADKKVQELEQADIEKEFFYHVQEWLIDK
jgi:hypothetical protein